jgi:hypothetical protein
MPPRLSRLEDHSVIFFEQKSVFDVINYQWDTINRGVGTGLIAAFDLN